MAKRIAPGPPPTGTQQPPPIETRTALAPFKFGQAWNWNSEMDAELRQAAASVAVSSSSDQARHPAVAARSSPTSTPAAAEARRDTAGTTWSLGADGAGRHAQRTQTPAVGSRQLVPELSACVCVASASGQPCEVVSDLRVGDLAFTDRDYRFTDLGSFLPTKGFGYVRVANSDKTIASDKSWLTITSTVPVTVYLVFYRPNSQEHETKRPWVSEEGWGADRRPELPTWTMPGQQIDEVRTKSCGPGSTVIRGNNAVSGTALVFFELQPTAAASSAELPRQRSPDDYVVPDGFLNMDGLGKKRKKASDEAQSRDFSGDVRGCWHEVKGFAMDLFGLKWLDADGDGKLEFSDLTSTVKKQLDADGDGDVEWKDLVVSKVEGPSALEASNRIPFFIVLQTILAAGWWFVGSLQGSTAVSWMDRVGGLETLLPGRTSLMTNSDCQDYRNEVWRWVSHQFTHVGFSHIFANSMLNLLLGIQLERFHGSAKMMAMYNAGVLGGALCYMVADAHNQVVGMSGGCYSLLGIQLGQLILNWGNMPYRRPKAFLLVAVVLIDTMLTMYSHQGEGRVTTSHACHFGGAVTGGIMCVLVGRNLETECWERWLQATLLLLGLALTTFCLAWGLSWPPRNIFEEEPWCWIRQVSNATVFGDWEWRCVRCHSQECIDGWSIHARLYTVSLGVCNDWGFASTEMRP